MPVRPAPLRVLWLGPIGAVLFLTSATIQGAAERGYDSKQQAVSALALGEHGWVASLSFFMFGASLLATVPAWRSLLASVPPRGAYPILIAIMGVGLIAAGALRQDPAPGYDPQGLGRAPTIHGLVHLAIAAVVATSAVASLLVMARRLARDEHWAGWSTSARAFAAATIVCVAVYAVSSTRPTGLGGLFERVAILFPAGWTAAFLRRLARRPLSR
jgi:hypothetical protein